MSTISDPSDPDGPVKSPSKTTGQAAAKRIEVRVQADVLFGALSGAAPERKRHRQLSRRCALRPALRTCRPARHTATERRHPGCGGLRTALCGCAASSNLGQLLGTWCCPGSGWEHCSIIFTKHPVCIGCLAVATSAHVVGALPEATEFARFCLAHCLSS